jgi:hypothetical protein
VYAVVSILIYGWTTYRFIQKLPSWLFYLRGWEILENYSLTLVINLLEALLVTALILLLNFVLPSKFFMEKFVARGSLLSALSLGFLIYLAIAIGESKSSQFPSGLFNWSPLVFMVILASAILLPSLNAVGRVMEEIAERAVIFLYVLLPLSGLGVLFFLYVNLF